MAIIDKSNMRKDILEFPKQFRTGLDSAKNVRVSGTFDAITVCGVGGSALPGDILGLWLKDQQIDLPLYTHRNYGLPYQTDQNHLVICVSYSGNTEETLSAFREALNRKIKMAAIFSGGKLAELCKKHGVPFAKIAAGLQPRMALGLQFAALMKILANSGIIKNDLNDISNLADSLKPGALENEGKKLAKKTAGKIPLIYSSEKWRDLARIWKIKFNENSKIPAFSNYFPELNHNEHSQFEWQKSNQFALFILRDKADLPRISKRMKLLAQMLKPKKIQTQFIDIDGKDALNKAFKNILLSDWTSYYLALEYKIDPTPVSLNDEFKKRLAK